MRLQGQEGRGGSIPEKQLRTRKVSPQIPACPTVLSQTTFPLGKKKKPPPFSVWFIQVFAKWIQEGKHSARTQRFIQRGFFKPFSSKYKWMSHPQPDCCFIPNFFGGGVCPSAHCSYSLQEDGDGWIHSSVTSYEGKHKFAGKKHPTLPKKEGEKPTLQYCRGFSSLPEESVEARGSPWLHGKLGDVKKVFLEVQEKRSTRVISALLVHTAPVPVPNQKAPINKVT